MSLKNILSEKAEINGFITHFYPGKDICLNAQLCNDKSVKAFLALHPQKIFIIAFIFRPILLSGFLLPVLPAQSIHAINQTNLSHNQLI